MHTPAVFIFNDKLETFSVYKRFHGDPTSAAEYLNKACCLAFSHFDAADFAAAFVAANYSGGDVKLCRHPIKLPYEFHYYISSNGKELIVEASRKNGDRVHSGTLAEYTAYVNS